MRIDRRLLTHFEWMLPAFVLAITGIGILTVHSASFDPAREGLSPLATRQAAWFLAGVVAMVAVLTFDYRSVDRRALLVYGAMLASLALVPVIGQIGGGSRRWLRLGSVSFQPSEFMKLGLVVVLAHGLARTEGVRLGPRAMAVPLALTAIPAALILVQPDLGSAAMLAFVAGTMLLLGGVRLRWLLALASPVLPLAPILWTRLEEYQRKRILTFLDPSHDPLGAGYHIIQSKIAVGSGGLWGKGFMQGTQNHLDFLPEQHTDFIFSVFSEEWGFVGSAGLMLLYLGLLLRGLVIASRARDRFGALVVLGVLTIVFWQIVVNIGMVTGLLPVVGIPLPFFSYGGSSLFCLLVGIGLAMNVSMRRFLYQRPG